jgi:peptidoglycan/LPS O-acetylase OafA/YrhL
MRKISFYHPELDIVRFAAFFVVFVHHVLPQNREVYSKYFGTVLSGIIASTVTAGGLGVDLFFCLSSFLITKLLIIEHDQTDSIDIKSFYVRRILRIWPLYLLFMLLTIFVFPTILQNESLSKLQTLSFMLFFANWSCAFSGYPSSVAAPLWSVSIEEQFYLTWPVMLKILKVKNIVKISISMFVLSMATRMYLVFIGVEHPAIWCNTFARLDPIAAGAILAYYHGKIKYVPSSSMRIIILTIGLSLPVSYLYFYDIASFSGYESLLFYPVVAFACTIILSAIIKENIHVKTQSSLGRFLVHLGRISYGLYVYHVLSISIVNTYYSHIQNYIFGNFTLPSIVIKFVLSLALTIILADLTYRWLEAPFLSLKKKFSRISSAPVKNI